MPSFKTGNFKTGRGRGVSQEIKDRNAAETAKYQAESAKLNSFGNLAWQAVKPTNTIRSIRTLGSQAVQHPLRTAGAIGSGVYDQGLRPLLNAGINFSPVGMVRSLANKGRMTDMLPKLGFNAQNDAEKGIYEGFGIGGMAGSYMLGSAALRPIMEAPRVVNALSRISPKLIQATAKGDMMKPVVQELIGDQVLTQALAGTDASWKDRASQAALAPIMTGALHGLGRSASFAGSQAKRAFGTADDSALSKMNFEQVQQYLKDRPMPPGFRINPKTGQLENADFIAAALKSEQGTPVPQGTARNLWDKISSSTAARIEKMGKPGKALVDMMREQQFRASTLKAHWKPRIQQAFKGLDGDSRARIQVALEHPEAKARLRTNQELLAFNTVDGLRKTVYNWAKNNDLKIKDGDKMIEWVGMDPDTYMPHYFPEKIKSSKKFREDEINRLMTSGEATTWDEASQIFDDWSKNHMVRRAGTLEYQRKSISADYEKDPEKVFQMYTDQVSRRMPEIEMFGQSHEKIKPLLTKIDKLGFDRNDAQSLIDAMYSSKPRNKIVDAALKWNLFTKLSLSGFQNLTQTTNTIAQGGLLNTAKVIKRWLLNPASRESMKDLANTADAFDEIIASSEANLNPGMLMKMALGVFKWTEKVNRSIAANVGKLHAEDLYSALKKDPTNATAVRGLEHLGLNVQKIIKQGVLSQEDLSRAAYNMVGTTQFRIDPLNLPLWTRTDAGKFFTQFQSFSFMQTKFYRDQIIREAQKGNLMPLVRMMVTAPPAYFAAKGLRNVIARKKDKEGMTEEEKDKEFLNTILGMTGTLPGSLLQRGMYAYDNAFGPKNQWKSDLNKVGTVAGNFLGPSVSDISGIINAGEQAGKIRFENINERPENQIDANYPYKRMMSGMIPYVGPGIKNTFYGSFPQRQRAVFRDALTEAVREAVKTGSKDKILEVMKQNPTMNGLNVLQDVYREVRLEGLDPKTREMYDALKKRKEELNYLPILK